jgi:hypothetical protein
MDYWNNKIHISREAAEHQIAIINKIPASKRLNIALEFANFGVDRTRQWIRDANPYYSELEVTLEFVRLAYYATGEMSEEYWRFYSNIMQEKIRKNWSARFRKMMEDKGWSYEDVARLGGFKSGKVIEATISRGLPSFARLSVVIHELSKEEK